jgi:hypothetical protein
VQHQHLEVARRRLSEQQDGGSGPHQLGLMRCRPQQRRCGMPMGWSMEVMPIILGAGS